jgi:hypothetical protein
MQEFNKFITKHRQSTPSCVFTTTADPSRLQGKQLAVFELIKHHMQSNDFTPLRMIVLGTAGTENHI